MSAINFVADGQYSCVDRAGRCGRAGRPGLVINFATPMTKFVVRRFGKQLGVDVMDCEIRGGTVHLKGGGAAGTKKKE